MPGESRELRHIRRLLILVALSVIFSPTWASCGSELQCDKCAKGSEFSWNPEKQDTSARLQRFYAVGDELAAAYKGGEFDKAKELANENLNLAKAYRCNWNYGNAIHESYSILGQISLNQGDLDGAIDDLRKAGESPGSPQLDTFGPDLDLADELLQRGKSDAVRSYLLEIKRFWKMNDGKIDGWVAEIDKGDKPRLNRFSETSPSPVEYLLSGLAILWPVIVTSAVLAFLRNRLTRKLLFFVLSTVIGYALMFGCSVVLWFVSTAMLISLAGFGIPDLIAVILPIVISMSLPLGVAFVVARYFRSGPAPALPTP